MNFLDDEPCTRVILNILSRIFLSGVDTLLWHVLSVYVTVKSSGNSNRNIFLSVGVLDFYPIRNSTLTCIQLACKFIAYVQYRVHTTALSCAFLSHGMSEFHATGMFSLAADTLLRVHVGTCKYAKRALSLSLADGWHGVSHTPTAACYYCSVCPKPKPCAATPLVLVWAEKEISHEFSTRNKNKWMKKFFAIIKVGLPRRVVCICFDWWWLWKSVHSNAYHRCIATGQSPRIRWRTRNNVQVSVEKSMEKYPQKSRNTRSSV